MSCNCIAEIEKNMSERGCPEFKIINTVILFPSGEDRLYLPCEYRAEGRQTKKKDKFFPAYCPFCGKKIEEVGNEM